jgi:hypothetical protein
MSLISKVITNHPCIRHRVVAVVSLGNYEVGGTFCRWNHSKVQVHRALVDKIRKQLQPLPSASGLKFESFADQEPGGYEEQVSLPYHNRVLLHLRHAECQSGPNHESAVRAIATTYRSLLPFDRYCMAKHFGLMTHS